MSNRFKTCESVSEVVFQAIGAGSVCWQSPGKAGEFNSTEAKLVGDEAIEKISELIGKKLVK